MDRNAKDTAAVSFAIANTNRNSNRYANRVSNGNSVRNSNRRSFALRPLSFTPSVEDGYYLGNSLPRPPSYVHHYDGENIFIENDLFQQAREQNILEQDIREKREKSIREDNPQDLDEQEQDKAEITDIGEDFSRFKPGYRFYLAFIALSVLALMVSLDGTSVSVALPVRHPVHGRALFYSSVADFHPLCVRWLIRQCLDIGSRSSRHSNRGFLGGNELSADVVRLSTTTGRTLSYLRPHADTRILHRLLHCRHYDIGAVAKLHRHAYRSHNPGRRRRWRHLTQRCHHYRSCAYEIAWRLFWDYRRNMGSRLGIWSSHWGCISKSSVLGKFALCSMF